MLYIYIYIYIYVHREREREIDMSVEDHGFSLDFWSKPRMDLGIPCLNIETLLQLNPLRSRVSAREPTVGIRCDAMLCRIIS